jgi:tetratricopeptide (TPR) repeat protein
LARFLRLGELLARAGHHEAALIEYAKADVEDGKSSPLLQTRIAESHLALGDLTTARSQLQRTLAMYPDHAPAWLALARLETSLGRKPEATLAFQKASSLNPYDAEVHEILATSYRELGDTRRAARHAEQLRILQRGGEG